MATTVAGYIKQSDTEGGAKVYDVDASGVGLVTNSTAQFAVVGSGAVIASCQYITTKPMTCVALKSYTEVAVTVAAATVTLGYVAAGVIATTSNGTTVGTITVSVAAAANTDTGTPVNTVIPAGSLVFLVDDGAATAGDVRASYTLQPVEPA